MALNTSFSSINSLGDFAFIAGCSYTMKFNVYDQDGNTIDISAATCTWKLSPYGLDSAVVTKTGSVIATNVFSVVLAEADTESLSGKYAHQPIVEFSTGEIVKPAQGTITIIKGIS